MTLLELTSYWWQPSVFGVPRALAVPASITFACMAAYMGLISGHYWKEWDGPMLKADAGLQLPQGHNRPA